MTPPSLVDNGIPTLLELSHVARRQVILPKNYHLDGLTTTDSVISFTSARSAITLGLPPTVDCRGKSRHISRFWECGLCGLRLRGGVEQTWWPSTLAELCGKDGGGGEFWRTQLLRIVTDHVQLWHGESTVLSWPYVCATCGMRFSDPEAYLDHSYNRVLNAGFYCTLCQYPVAKRMPNIKVHLVKLHTLVNASSEIDALTRNIKNKHKLAAVQCSSDFLEDSQGQVVQIVQFFSPSDAARLGVTQRVLCDDSAPRQIALLSGGIRYMRMLCGDCHERFIFSFSSYRWDNKTLDKTLATYWDHVQRCHNALARRYRCFKCSERFSDRLEFVEHTFRLPESGCCCTRCGLSYPARHRLKFHECVIETLIPSGLSHLSNLEDNVNDGQTCDEALVDTRADGSSSGRPELPKSSIPSQSSTRKYVFMDDGRCQCTLCEKIYKSYPCFRRHYLYYHRHVQKVIPKTGATSSLKLAKPAHNSGIGQKRIATDDTTWKRDEKNDGKSHLSSFKSESCVPAVRASEMKSFVSNDNGYSFKHEAKTEIAETSYLVGQFGETNFANSSDSLHPLLFPTKTDQLEEPSCTRYPDSSSAVAVKVDVDEPAIDDRLSAVRHCGVSSTDLVPDPVLSSVSCSLNSFHEENRSYVDIKVEAEESPMDGFSSAASAAVPSVSLSNFSIGCNYLDSFSVKTEPVDDSDCEFKFEIIQNVVN